MALTLTPLALYVTRNQVYLFKSLTSAPHSGVTDFTISFTSTFVIHAVQLRALVSALQHLLLPVHAYSVLLDGHEKSLPAAWPSVKVVLLHACVL